MSFELPLAEGKVNRQQVVALHLIVGFTLIFTGVFSLLLQFFLNHITEDKRTALVSFYFSPTWSLILLFGGIFLLVISVMKNKWLLEKNTNRIVRVTELLVLLCLAAFAAKFDMIVPSVIYGLVASAILFAVYWENATGKTLYIQVDDRGIRLPVTTRKRLLEWWEVEQVLLRFNILTIDCHDNRLFQWNINSIDFDKENFQQFCNERIAASKEKRKKYAW